MNAIPEQMLARHKAAVDSMIATQAALFGGFEKLVDLNVKVMRATLDEVALQAQQSTQLKDPQDAAAYLSSVAQPGGEKAMAYGKHVYDIVSGVQGELAKLQEAHVAQSQAQAAEMLDQWSKNAPAGSEGALSAMKTSLATANSAYDAMTRAARQAADVAESNLNAATNASFKAASDAADAVNKASTRTRRSAV